MSILPPAAPLVTTPIPYDLSVELAPRIMKRIYLDPRTGCWIRTAAVNPQTGYTAITKTIDFQTTYFYAHRVMYTFSKGVIPEGYTVDHMCEVPPCCNPAHLQAVTLRDNVLRSLNNPAAINARRVRCPQGHPYGPLREGRKKRSCVVCRAERRLQKREVSA